MRIKTGPRGGKYYVKNGKKVYVKKEAAPKRRLKSGKPAGGSNAGRYKGVPKDLFCGPAGGAPPGSFPCDSPPRCRAALSYARNAPRPEGIRKCVRRISKRKGWADPRTGKLRMSKRK